MFGWAEREEEVQLFAEKGGLSSNDADSWTQYRSLLSELDGLNRYVSSDADVSPRANLIGPVYVEAGAQILPGAYVEGPTYIGQNALVGTCSLIRGQSFLSRETVIGNHCYCTEAVLGPETGVFHLSGISRSILDRGCHISAFVVTGTTRPDLQPVVPEPNLEGVDTIQKRGCIIHENTYISPHVVTSPNITIGRNSFIGPFVHLDEDTPDQTYVETSLSSQYSDNKITDVQIDDPPRYPFGDEFNS